MAEKFGWAYIGAGAIAYKTAGYMQKLSKHHIVSVYNRTYSKAEDFAVKNGAVPCRTIKEALAEPGVDAVYITTTNDNHYASCKECLLAGKPVLLEKPFTINKTEALELVKIAEAQKLYLAEAMWTWFSPVSRQVKQWVESGEIGDIKDIEICFAKRVDPQHPRLFEPKLGGGALLDVGVYPLTYLYNLLGCPEDIKCEGTFDRGVDVEDKIILTYPGGLCVAAEVSVVRFPDYENLVITGTAGTIKCPNFHTAVKAELIKPDDGINTFEGNGWYDNQFSIVADEIRDGKLISDYVPLKATLDVMEIMDECRRQMGLRYPFE